MRVMISPSAVAAEAGVQLSLTTYYFKNLGELITEAFRMFMERDREDMAERWQKAFRYLDRFDEAGLAEPANQKRIIEYMSQRIINEVDGISRVVYDISGKPPATIEWE